MKTRVVTKSSQGMIVFAKKFLEKALKEAQENAPLIFYLEGELGAGKTHFVKGLAEGLGIMDNITSPTFVLIKKYVISSSDAAQGAGKSVFFHIDCYRMYDSEDARQIGLDKILENPRAIVAVEWAERIADIVPKPHWKLTFQHIDGKTRKIVIKNVKR